MANRKPFKGKQLAKPGDPLVLGNGKVINEVTDERQVDSDNPLSGKTFKPRKRRNVKELPAPFAIMKGIVCVLGFTVLGMGEREIAEALGVTVDDVRGIKKHSAYGETFELILDEFVSTDSTLLVSRLAAYGHTALTTVAKMAKEAKQESTQLKASIDLLNRGGITKEQALAQKNGGMNDLRIIMIDGNVENIVTV